ncbi:MAG: hypothetical protein M2R45_03638 [Verrucomicrobia subdivision 3 bacterium]|nr:hypothetical protein [Limisphaerales bacterium]MCS1416866.1 hypothetical protein [Limisphaerales bacterium]
MVSELAGGLRFLREGDQGKRGLSGSLWRINLILNGTVVETVRSHPSEKRFLALMQLKRRVDEASQLVLRPSQHARSSHGRSGERDGRGTVRPYESHSS